MLQSSSIFRYRICNWCDYNRALINRGRLTVWFDEHAITAWRVLSGRTRQSIAENTMFRFKQLFGGRLWARRHATQRTEALVKCTVLNRMTQLGMPETVRIG